MESGRNLLRVQSQAVDLQECARLIGVELGFWRHGFDYGRSCRQVFRGIDLRGKTVLEIGCGNSLRCIWASIQGAREVIGLEPIVEGSFASQTWYSDFRTMVKRLQLNHIELLPYRLQDYPGREEHFDVVLCLASINHLDEASCINLRSHPEAREAYAQLFDQIARLMKTDGKLILVDASPRNFFGDLGLKNPFMPSIEWFKHQTAEDWAELASHSGFSNAKTTWMAGRALRYLGISDIPRVASYFSSSLFRLELTRSKPAATTTKLAASPDRGSLEGTAARSAAAGK